MDDFFAIIGTIFQPFRELLSYFLLVVVSISLYSNALPPLIVSICVWVAIGLFAAVFLWWIISGFILIASGDYDEDGSLALSIIDSILYVASIVAVVFLYVYRADVVEFLQFRETSTLLYLGALAVVQPILHQTLSIIPNMISAFIDSDF